MPIENIGIYSLLSSNDHYIIPIYQRNYAWESKEIEQLIQDVIDAMTYDPNANYYIGSLIVADGNGAGVYQTIDGQQRLTTLNILTAVLRNEFLDNEFDWYTKPNIYYASRKISHVSLEAVFNGKFNEQEYEPHIKEAYEICMRVLAKRREKICLKDFADYLYHKVIVLRVILPATIDLNHYFEIMNSRGEQLEKHEVLKARLMKYFSGCRENREIYESCFDLIWEACANMEKYVQYGFGIEQRDTVFGED